MEQSQDRAIQRLEQTFRNEDQLHKANGLRHALATYEGRRFLWSLFVETNIFSPSFSPDPYLTAYNEGRRSYGLSLLELLNIEAPETYLQMQKENADVYRDRNNRVAAVNTKSDSEPY